MLRNSNLDALEFAPKMSVFVKLPAQTVVSVDFGKDELVHALGKNILPWLALKFGCLHADDLAKCCYLTCSGYLLKPEQIVKPYETLYLQCRVLGGKGGFGSLLRSFGKKRVKTKNKNMCRDLSGRRVRDVQTEKRLKEWAKKVGTTSTSSVKVQKQAAKDNRIQRIKEKLEGTDKKHLLNDPEWTRERHRIPNFIHDAVRDGVKAASSKLVEMGLVKGAAKAIADVGSDADVVAQNTRSRAQPSSADLQASMPVSSTVQSTNDAVPNTPLRKSTRVTATSLPNDKSDDVDIRKLRDWCGVGQLGIDADDDSDMSDIEEMVVTKRTVS